MPHINIWAVLAATLLSIVWGSLWYGPFFGKAWTKMMGWTKEDMKKGAADKLGMMRSYGIQLIGSLVMVFVLANSIVFAKVAMSSQGILVGLTTAFWNWIGFVAPATLANVLWEGKSWKLWLLYNGYYLTFLLLAGSLLSLWV